jgi:AraC family transcriptional regulator
LKVELLLLALGRRVGRTFGGARRPRDDGWLHPAALARIVEMLRSDPASPPRLAEMAREAGLGVSAFVRAFRGSTGSTPAAFARRLRLQQAAEILRSSRRSISETAAMQGFASASHLIQAFHSEHGVTPGRWRAQGDLRDGVPVRKSA